MSRKAQQTRSAILDAALACYEAHGIAATRLDDVARRAGVGRTTLYRYVSSRDDLLNQVLLRDAAQQQAEAALLTRYQQGLEEVLVEGVVHVMRGRRSRPINRLLFGDGESGVLQRINLSPATFEGMAQELLREPLQRAREAGELRDGLELEEVAHWVARVLLSLVSHPEPFLDDEPALRQFLRSFLLPPLLRG